MKTRIIMSFAMAQNGWAFSHWLWLRLKRQYGLHEVGDVYNDYLDNVDLPLPPGGAILEQVDYRESTGLRPQADVSVPLLAEKHPGTAEMLAWLWDRRGERDWSTVPARPIGRRREDWEQLFTLALQQAQVALVILTQQYAQSSYCTGECTLFAAEIDRRARDGAAPLRVVVLYLVPDDTEHVLARLPSARIVYGHRHFAFDKTRSDTHPERFEPLLTDAEHWKIEDDVYARLLDAIGPLS
ncbi:hypothetical protein NFI95_07915 [Acetobacteraceae bacterium KSS8]|uniref:TIR domain-containing protein n=1 Tax=Endosaccharibacter trunci TaxID=2812733 RepID=A0ABT1W668_9PROT|nr:hypothetical protein [Acetobacteraceae bacterium KSS8]